MAREDLLFLLALISVALPTLGLSYSAPAPVWRTYTSSSYYFTDYSYPKPQAPSKPRFAPPPQFCPDTGRTVCADVEAYPSEQMFQLVTSTKTRRFNFSSVFFDERDGDQEPNFDVMPPAPPKSIQSPQDGYIVYQTSVHYDYQHSPTNAPAQWGYVAPAPGVATYPRTPFASTGFPVQQQQQRFRKKRQAPDANEDVEVACGTRTQYVAPKAALSDDSNWKYVINLQDKNPNYKQVVKVSVCRSVNTPCSNQVSLPLGYISRCAQKYTKKNMLAISMDGQSTEEVPFFIPSCCVCEIVAPNKK